METERPHCKPGLYCPLWRKDVSKVCHTCAWFSHVTGTDPQTGAPVSQWMCAQTMMVLATMDAAKAAYEGGAVTQHLRNDLLAERQQQARLLISRPLMQPQSSVPLLSTRAIENEVEN